MNVQGSVALVIDAGKGIGTAIATALLARGAARVYRTAREARRHADVNLLVNCLSARQLLQSGLAGADLRAVGRLMSPAGPTLQRIDEFAPMLAANGGGAVVNVMCVRDADGPGIGARQGLQPAASRSVDWVLSVGLQDRLAAQGTALIFFRAHMASAHGTQVPDEQRALNRHVAMRVLERLESTQHHPGVRTRGPVPSGLEDGVAPGEVP